MRSGASAEEHIVKRGHLVLAPQRSNLQTVIENQTRMDEDLSMDGGACHGRLTFLLITQKAKGERIGAQCPL